MSEYPNDKKEEKITVTKDETDESMKSDKLENNDEKTKDQEYGNENKLLDDKSNESSSQNKESNKIEENNKNSECLERCQYNTCIFYDSFIGRFDNENYVYFKITQILFIFLFQNILYLILFLYYNYSSFEHREKTEEDIIICIGVLGPTGGIAFDMVKYKQYKNDEFIKDNNHFATTIFFLFITCTKTAIHALYYIICYNLSDLIIINPELDSLITLILPVIYYITLILFVYFKKGVINYAFFLLIGVIYIIILNLILFILSSSNDLISGLILSCLEIFAFNIGLSLANNINVLKSDSIIWNVIHIEIYRLYPILALLGFLLILVLIGMALGCCIAFCYLLMYRREN